MYRVEARQEAVRRDRHRCPRRGHDELGNSQPEWPLDDERHRTSLDGLGRELVPVGPLSGNAEEERTRADRPRVVREVGDVCGSASADLQGPKRGDQPLEIHEQPGG